MIVILGSTGFVGKSLSNYLAEQKIPFIGISSKDIDLTRDSSVKKLTRIFNSKTTLVFASSIVREKGDNFENMQKNIDMAKNISEAIQRKPIKKLIFISSIDVYGKPKDVITERTLTDPQTPYGISKLTSEQILKVAAQKLAIPFLILRLGGIYGSGQLSNKYGPNSFINDIVEKKSVNIYGDGLEKRDLVFVNDLCKIILELATNNSTGILNIATGQQYSFKSIAKILEIIIGEKIKVNRQKRSSSKTDLRISNKLLKTYLPKKFKFTDIKEGLKITVDSITSSN